MSVQPSEILKSTVVNSIKGKFNEGSPHSKTQGTDTEELGSEIQNSSKGTLADEENHALLKGEL